MKRQRRGGIGSPPSRVLTARIGDPALAKGLYLLRSDVNETGIDASCR